MANCPTCGSNHIQIKKETNASWGRAATGYMLFGLAGAAVGLLQVKIEMLMLVWIVVELRLFIKFKEQLKCQLNQVQSSQQVSQY
jgi:hypothetical protein